MGADAAQIADFLHHSGWEGALRTALAGDASARRYERLHRGRDTAVLMIAPPGEEVHRFQRVDDWLLRNGFSAPRIHAVRAEAGLMLLEDFGDEVLARRLARQPEAEPQYYAAITDFLLELHRLPPPDFAAPLDGPGLGALVDLTSQWYPLREAPAAGELSALVATLYAELDPLPPVLSLRDFHAENVIWLPARAGSARLGLLDFQDAVATHPAYDLVSALQDARRDVSPALEAAQRLHYATARGLHPDRFARAYALLGAQRALRILGIFARLCLCHGKPQYLALMPRVWGSLQRNLSHDGIAPLRRAVDAALAPPDDAVLERMTQECGRHPMR
jgi:aminoglycoside/choline kinase family phosphotransferase